MEKYNILSDRRITPRIEAALPLELKVENSSADFASNVSAEAVNLSETGLCLASESRLPVHSSVVLYIDSPPYLPMEIEAQVVWADSILKENRLHCGVRFLELNIEIFKQLLGEIHRQHIANFLGIPLTHHLKERYQDNYILAKFEQQQISEIIDFSPPFLKIDKVAVLGFNRSDFLQTKALGTGLITPKDTAGHYNDTIFLAFCGRLMASLASIHLAILFPETAPQVIEANGVRSEDRRVWKPSPQGTRFLVETNIVKRKLQLIVTSVKLSFDGIPYGVVDELKLFLTPKESIWEAKELPPWR